MNSSSQIAIAITNAPKGTGYLGFRELPEILKKYVHGNEVLDVGCGTGRSTRFLRDLGYKVIGIDHSLEMIEKARVEDSKGDYRVGKAIKWTYSLQRLKTITLVCSLAPPVDPER